MKFRKFIGLNEIFSTQGNVNDLPRGKEKDLQMLRLAMIAELDAVNLYKQMAAFAQDNKVKGVMLEIAREEKVHAGEFEEVMEMLDPDYEKTEEEGEGEVIDMINKEGE